MIDRVSVATWACVAIFCTGFWLAVAFGARLVASTYLYGAAPGHAQSIPAHSWRHSVAFTIHQKAQGQ